MSSGFLLRVCHGKTDRLRFLSHLELVRALERSVRRADLPFAVSQGFSPHMRLAFGPALPVGSAGLGEWLDVHMTDFVPVEEAASLLALSTPRGLAPVRLGYVHPASPSLSASLTFARYEVSLPAQVGAEALARSLAELLDRGSLQVSRKGKVRTYDLSEAIWETPAVAAGPGGLRVRLGLRLGEQGSLRPEALVTEALEYSGARASALIVTRTALLQERDGTAIDPLD